MVRERNLFHNLCDVCIALFFKQSRSHFDFILCHPWYVVKILESLLDFFFLDGFLFLDFSFKKNGFLFLEILVFLRKSSSVFQILIGNKF